MKNIPEATYLNLTGKQAQVLERFGQGKTAANVLEELIWHGKAPRLLEYFELIIKAYDNRILVEKGFEHGPLRKPCNDFPGMSVWAVWLLVSLLIPFAIWASWSSPIILPESIADVFMGLLYGIIALSLGKFLAASLLARNGGEVYDPGWSWKAFLPHWSVDLIDGRVVHPSIELYMGFLRLLPLFMFFGAASLYHPGSASIILLVLWGSTFPRRFGAIDQILKGLTHRVALDIHRDFRFFSQQKSFNGRFNFFKYENKSYLWLKVLYFCLWISFLIGAAGFSLPYYYNGLTVAVEPRRLFWLASTIIIFSGIAYLVYLFVRDAFPTLWQKIEQNKEQKEKRRLLASYNEENPPSTEARIELLQGNPIFKRLARPHLENLARKMNLEIFPKRALIAGGDDPSERLHLLIYGEVGVSRKLSTGKVLKVTDLEAGSVFGKIPFGQETHVSRTLRAKTRVSTLSLDPIHLENCEAFRLEKGIVQNGMKLTFLNQYRPFSKWPSELIREIALESSMMNFKQGETIIHLNQPNQFFYIVYDGILQCLNKGRLLRTYRLGDYFGELSVLRNALAVADVICQEDGKCLVIRKKTLLRILTKYPEALLQMERIASRRLGRAIFPVKEGSGWNSYNPR